MKMAAKGYRVNFIIPYDVSERASNLAKEMNISLSELARKSLQQMIERIEKEKLDQLLIEGYKANSQYYKNEAKIWENVERELR